MRIVSEGLTYIYNEKSPFTTRALDSVSLTIETGEFFGIIGHTGRGKSTFVQHLNGLIQVGEFGAKSKESDYIGILPEYRQS